VSNSVRKLENVATARAMVWPFAECLIIAVNKESDGYHLLLKFNNGETEDRAIGKNSKLAMDYIENTFWNELIQRDSKGRCESPTDVSNVTTKYFEDQPDMQLELECEGMDASTIKAKANGDFVILTSNGDVHTSTRFNREKAQELMRFLARNLAEWAE
jgi:hypothetical protein